MKLRISSVLVLAVIAAVVGYLMGTADGRERRDAVVGKIRGSRQTVVEEIDENGETVGMTIVEETIVTSD